MTRTDHIRLMADYNEWMNAKLYEAAKSLPAEAQAANQGAFFGSILGTLNHLAVGDTMWLRRFSGHPAAWPVLDAVAQLPTPTRLDQMLFADIHDLYEYRVILDRMIKNWVQTIQEEELDYVLCYANTKGVVARRNFFSLLMHFFNHQTHHRGQATTLLCQAGVDVGITDLLKRIPDHAEDHSG